MPTDSNILGFSNRWYEEGIEIKIQKTLPDETKILYFHPNITWLQNLKRTIPGVETIYDKAMILRTLFTF